MGGSVCGAGAPAAAAAAADAAADADALLVSYKYARKDCGARRRASAAAWKA
jgi:hypothetical protein